MDDNFLLVNINKTPINQLINITQEQTKSTTDAFKHVQYPQLEIPKTPYSQGFKFPCIKRCFQSLKKY